MQEVQPCVANAAIPKDLLATINQQNNAIAAACAVFAQQLINNNNKCSHSWNVSSPGNTTLVKITSVAGQFILILHIAVLQ